MRLVGYARVSTNDQDTALQLDALSNAGVSVVYREAGSGVGPRPQLQSAMATLQQGDVLVVWKIDRIARSLSGLLRVLERLHSLGVGLRSLTEPIDTATPIGEFVVHILGAVAQFERGIIRERCMAGQSAAMARGVHCGRPRALDPDVEADIVRLYRSRWYTLDSLAFVFDCHPSTVKRAVYRVSKPGHSSLK